jgi:outer membrane protein
LISVRCLILLAGLIALPQAAGAAELKIGFLDAERINRESAPAVRASKELEREFAPRILELQKMERQLKEGQAALEKDGMTMSESERSRREQDLVRINSDFQRANKVIQQIAEAEKFDLILQEAVYRSPRIDITDKVLKALGDK